MPISGSSCAVQCDTEVQDHQEGDWIFCNSSSKAGACRARVRVRLCHDEPVYNNFDLTTNLLERWITTPHSPIMQWRSWLHGNYPREGTALQDDGEFSPILPGLLLPGHDVREAAGPIGFVAGACDDNLFLRHAGHMILQSDEACATGGPFDRITPALPLDQSSCRAPPMDRYVCVMNAEPTARLLDIHGLQSVAGLAVED
jgi:hypothetical protein